MSEEGPMRQNDTTSGPPEQPETPIQIPELTDVDMLSGKVVELEKNIEQLRDQLLRKAADFDNYKKRVENDYASTVRFANEDLIVSLLPVIDDIERSLKAAKLIAGSSQGGQRGGADDPILRGVELIYSKFLKILEKQDVKPLDVVGKPFDPHYHDALLQIQNDSVPPHTVLEEVEKGYLLHDRVIRHAKVIVSSEPAAPPNSQESASN